MKRLWVLVGFTALVCGVVFIVTPVASGATYNCSGLVTGGTINGNVSVTSGLCELEGTHVTGNVTVSGSGSLISNGSTIDGNVAIQNDSGSNAFCGTTIGGNLSVHNNTGSTSIGDGFGCDPNTVGGNVEIHNNAGPVTISRTHVGGNLDCHSDTPSASTGTGGNTVDGKSSGECTTSTTVSCPSTGCKALVSDGNTSATVDVPGGGKNGNLTLTLSSPPSDDGCGPYGEGGEPPNPSGDIVTIVPPGGYGPDNPITVDITFNFSQGLFEICKSNNGKPPYTALPPCTGFSESGTPSNVPCWEGIDEGNEALVYITSTDPSVGGHY